MSATSLRVLSARRVTVTPAESLTLSESRLRPGGVHNYSNPLSETVSLSESLATNLVAHNTTFYESVYSFGNRNCSQRSKPLPLERLLFPESVVTGGVHTLPEFSLTETVSVSEALVTQGSCPECPYRDAEPCSESLTTKAVQEETLIISEGVAVSEAAAYATVHPAVSETVNPLNLLLRSSSGTALHSMNRLHLEGATSRAIQHTALQLVAHPLTGRRSSRTVQHISIRKTKFQRSRVD